MNMALKSENDEGHIKFIPLYIKRHLEMGKRVIVGRLYGLDRESNPWYGLSDLGWSRAKIKTLLSDFCHSEVAKIDDVVFHEIKSCN